MRVQRHEPLERQLWHGHGEGFDPQCPRCQKETSSTQAPQPLPTHGRQEVWPLVMQDIAARNTAGIAKYGTPLMTHNGRDALVDAYQEALDLVVYLRQAIAERDAEKEDTCH